jgi:CHAT domain-containing protein
MSEARFNRAMVLEKLSLLIDARVDWRFSTRSGGQSGWTTEAQAHLDRLGGKAEEAWEVQEPRLAKASLEGKVATVHQVVTAFPQPARLYVEMSALKDWSEAESRGESLSASRALRSASVVASEYALIAKDSLLEDSVAAIKSATSRGNRNAAALIAAGHISYIGAMSLYESYDYKGAHGGFLTAWRELQSGGSPFGFWALFFSAACDYQASRYDEALATLSRIELKAPRHYETLRGRVFWLRGLILYVEAQPTLSQASYWQALRCFETTGEIEFQAVVQHLLGEVDFFLGNRDSAWRHLLLALQGSRTIRDSRRLQTIFQGAAVAALRDLLPQVALHFQAEAVRIAERSGYRAQIALALKERATIASLLGRFAPASADLSRAKRMVSSVGDERLLADILMAESKILSSVDPASALRSLSAALPLLRKTKYQEKLSLFYLDRGDLFQRLANLSAAERDFTAGVAEIEHTRGNVPLDSQQVFLDRYHLLYDRLLRVQVTRGGSLCAAYETAERSRSPHLFEQMKLIRRPDASQLASLSVTAAELRQNLPASTLLVEYAVMDDSLLIWAVRRGGMSCIRVHVTASELQAQVLALQEALASGAERDVLFSATSLFDLLISPLGTALHPTDVVVVVPDKFLASLPFSILRKRSSRRFLVEDHAIEVAASATIFRRGSRAKSGGLHASIFAVGDPAFDPTLSPQQGRLRTAGREAQMVASLYRYKDLALAERATKSQLLAALGHYSVIHFGGHAVPDPRAPGFSRLLLAPEHGDTGILFAHELEGRDFRGTDLVVLAACSTGIGPVSESEGISGLVRPLLAGGVAAVIGSLWAVDDRRATLILSHELHQRVAAGEDAAIALAGAQRALIRSSDSFLRNPSKWAAFELWGSMLPN